MSRCPTCRAAFDKGEQFCPRDGSPLSSQAASEAAELSAPTDLLIGRVLGGRYRLASRLGQGGMGTVYRAVKILRGELAGDGDAVARFHREARSASRLDHDHCIRVTDFGQSEDGLLFLAMELLEGRPLTARMNEGRLPLAEAASVGYAVAMALEHAHEAGVIHRDLKPDNIFLARRSRNREIVKVLDFGLAKLASDSGKSRSITQDGTIFGTPAYMAPEQAQGDALDARTDVYSLGVVLYHLFTGELPFHAETFVALLTKHVRERPPPPRQFDPSLPPALEAVILRCMAKKPADRYPTAGAVADALSPYLARAEATGPTVAVSPLGGLPALEPSATPDPQPREPDQRGEPEQPLSSFDALEQLDSAVLRSYRSRRTLGWALLGLLIGAAAAAWLALHRAPTQVSTSQAASLAEIKQLGDVGQLDEAASRLEALHRNGESSALEQATAEVAERRGRRLEALAHMHRAKTLSPTDPAVRVALAGLLLRLGQRADACQQASRALALVTSPERTAEERGTMAAARGILKGAACATP